MLTIKPRTIAVDFFCGAGGMTNGLIRAGVHVLAGVDNQEQCERTYIQNRNADGTAPDFICKNIFPQSRQYPTGQQHEIIAKVSELIAHYKKSSKHRRVNLIFAICAPCQPFTKITQIRMSEDRKFKRANDKNLLLTTINLIKVLKPDAIICENVEGLSDGPNSVLVRFKRNLRRYGYLFDARVINASRFGVPQNRKRTIGIGINSAKCDLVPVVPECRPDISKAPTVEQTIGDLPPIAAGEIHPRIPNHRARALTDLNLKRISCAPPGESNAYLAHTPYGDLSLDCHRRLKERAGVASFSDTYTRMAGDQLAPTITTKCMSITNGRFGHFDPKQNRAISPREAALLQTFTRDYVFYPEDKLDFTACLIGNAVPPKLAEYFGGMLRVKLESRRHRLRSMGD